MTKITSKTKRRMGVKAAPAMDAWIDATNLFEETLEKLQKDMLSELAKLPDEIKATKEYEDATKELKSMIQGAISRFNFESPAISDPWEIARNFDDGKPLVLG